MQFYFSPRKFVLSEGTPTLLIKLIVPFEPGWKAPIMELKMVVYDIEEYLADQRRLLREAGSGANPRDFETDLKLFTGNEGTADFQPSRDLRLPAQVFDLTAQKGNGVIATATLEVGRAEKESELKGLKNGGNSAWFIHNVIEGDFESHRGTDFAIDIKMMARSDKQGNFGQGTLQLRKIGSIGFNKEALQTSLDKTRSLAIRLISTRDDQGPLKQRQMALSSLHKEENTTGGPLGTRKITVDIALAQAKLQGPGKPTPINTDAGRIPSRRKDPDLTGWYEQVVEGVSGIDPSADDYIAPSALFLNQAGEALVGWYYPMDAVGLSSEFVGPASNHVPLAERACLVTLPSADFPKSAPAYWFFSEKKDPTEIIARIREADRKPSITIREALFTVTESGSIITDVVLALTSARVLDDGSPPDPTGDIKLAKFRRSNGSPRIAWLSIEQMRDTDVVNQQAVDEVVRSRVEPLPSGFWLRLARILREKMAAVVERFTKFPDDDEIVEQEFDRAGDIINEVVGMFPNQQYRLEALNWVRHFCNSMEFKNAAGDINKELREWLRDLSEKHFELEIKEREAELGVDALEPSERAALAAKLRAKNGGVLTDIGVTPANDFEYKFEFFDVEDTKEIGGSDDKPEGDDTDEDGNKRKKKAKAAIGITGGLFLCLVTKSKIVDNKPGPVEYEVQLEGAFVGIGAGFKREFPGGAGQPSAAEPPDCEIRSFHDIPKEAWLATVPSGVWFSLAAIATGFAGHVGPFDIDFLNASSSLFTLTFLFNEKDIHLSAILNDKLFDFEGRDVQDILKDFNEGNFAAGEATLFAISETFGYMTNLAFWQDAEPPEKPIPQLKEQDVPIDTLADVQLVSFENGSSVILAEARLDFDRRLAVYRALMELPGWYWCVGFASPAWDAHPDQADSKNQLLSESRAKAVDLLIEASIGAPGEGIVFPKKLHVAALGAGRTPALTPVADGGGGLHNPYDPNTPEPVAIKESWFDYQKWRRVDLVVNATLIARLKAP